MMTRATNSRKDRISVLPDLILSHILSYMPTKNAVVTSLLSKRWKFLWKAVHNLDFEFDLCLGFCPKQGLGCGKRWSMDEDVKFARFVNHVLFLHDGGFLNKFSLVWKPRCIPSHVISWISTAITRNLHELYLCVGHRHKPFEIPSSVFGCETLTSLELDGNMFVSDSVVVCLQKLERLKLVSVYFQSGEAFQKLISGCPVLNLLSIRIDWDIIRGYNQPYQAARTNLFTFKISSTSLRRLILNVVSNFHNFVAIYCSLELEAPSLESLCLGGFITQIFVQESLSSLIDAEFNIFNICEDQLSDVSFCNSLVEAIRGFDCAKDLYLSEYVLSALSRATISLSTKFRRLTKLKLGADCCYCSSLQEFIQSSDNLEVLIVDGIWKDSAYHTISDCNYIHTHPIWTSPVEVPGCLSNSLKTVEFVEYSGYDYECEMIGYMLLHGSVLEVMTIHGDIITRDDLKLKLLQEICAFPRKSPACKVKFI